MLLSLSPAATAALAPAASWGLALAVLALVLALGTGLGRILGSRKWGVPEALLAGVIGLLLAPFGPLPLIPPGVLAVWQELPLILLTLVFGTLLVGKPLPRPGGLWRPLSAQVLLALTLAFGQYLVAALVVMTLQGRLAGVHPLMACLIEVSYEGGHGSAAAMGPTYARLGFPGGEALGLAMATVGLLSSTLVGGIVVVVARRVGWLQVVAPVPPVVATKGGPAAAMDAAFAAPLPEATLMAPAAPTEAPTAAAALNAAGITAPSGSPAEPAGSLPAPSDRPESPNIKGTGTGILSHSLAAWAVNLALAGIAVGIGCLALEGLRWVAHALGGGFAAVIEALPVFPLAIIGSLLVRLVLERSGNASVASRAIQGLVATLAADLLITAATACLDLSLLAQDWIPLTALAVAGLAWNLAVVLLLGPRILPTPWFERAILEFGQATGVAASGLLLLRMADPGDQADALPAFSIKQLLLQPLIAGGVITVVAPLAVTRLGLPLWSGLCLVLVLLWIGLALTLARSRLRRGPGRRSARGSWCR
ncbi:MAG: sodium:solute symporter [Cyanobacteria bacterium]|nr:sodium:solute symporter [Cyanobacteriota bacterium]